MNTVLIALAESLEKKALASHAKATAQSEAAGPKDSPAMALAAMEAMRGTIYYEVASSVREALGTRVAPEPKKDARVAAAEVVLAQHLGFKPEAVHAEFRSLLTFQIDAAPLPGDTTSAYARSYQELGDAAESGGDIYHWSQHRTPYSEGFCVIANGNVVATLITFQG